MMEQKKLKVVLLTCFSNEAVRACLPLDTKRRMYTLVRKMMRLSVKPITLGDVAPWTTALIDEFENRDDIELHVIAPHVGLKKRLVQFDMRGVHYYFFKTSFTLFLKHLLKSDKMWRMLETNSAQVKRLINKIQPDIVNLLGAENAHLSVTSLAIKDFPIFVSCQTIYSNPNRIKYGEVNSKNLTTERLIHQKEHYFGCQGYMHHDLLLMNNPDAVIFEFQFPNRRFPKVKDIAKKYDFTTFALQNTEKKGIYDLLNAFAIVVERHFNATLNINGGLVEPDRSRVLELISKLHLEKNIVITPFFEDQMDLFKQLKKSKIAVLPVKLDIIPGTVIQAMALGLPLVANSTTGTPLLNKEKECVALVPIDDVQKLAVTMLKVYEDSAYAEMLKSNALEYYNQHYNQNDRIIGKLIGDYKLVVDNYLNGTQIPQDRLFDIDKFPKNE